MIIYLDYLIFKEVIINFIIIYLTSKISSQAISLKKMLISSIVSMVLSLVVLFFPIKITHFLKLLCATIILNISFKFDNVYTYMRTFCVFNIITFLLGGIFFYGEINHINCFIMTFLLVIFIKFFIKRYKRMYQIDNYIANIKMSEKSVELKALIDTGHMLTTCYDEPVIVLSNQYQSKINKKNLIEENKRKIFYKTIQNEMICADGEKVNNVKVRYKMEEYINDVVIIASNVNFDGYDAIIGLNFFEHAVKSNVTKENKEEKEKKYGDFIFN